MLVLTRKQNETIHLGDEVVITVIRLKNNQVQIGISAPEQMRILRGEIRQRALDVPVEKSTDSQSVA